MKRNSQSRGTILIVTMWIILTLAALVLLLARAMRVEAVCSANELSAVQAQAVEQAAIQYVLARTDGLQGKAPVDEDTPCEAVQVGEGGFWILRPDLEDYRKHAFGITDESGKLNLNSAAPAMLMKLPNMTDELAACIVDWRDGDSNITTGGAENEYYQMLPEARQCKNAPLETVEELLLVKGATDEIILGEDANRNGVLDENENDRDARLPTDNQDGQLDRGLLPLVTVYSAQPATTGTGGQRQVNVNMEPRSAIETLLRDNGVTLSSGGATTLASLPPPRGFTNVLDFAVKMKLTAEQAAKLVDKISTPRSAPAAGRGGAASQPASTVTRGLVNVNTASRQVLVCLPGLEDSDASALLSKRAETGVDLTNIAWVLGALEAKKAVGIGDRITVRSYQFSADIVSVCGDGRGFRRCRIVVDARQSPPRVVYRQDLTHLGWPLDPDIMDALRLGAGIERLAPGKTSLREENSR